MQDAVTRASESTRSNAPPEGFVPHDRKSRVTDPWEPLYTRRGGGVVELGVLLSDAHCNSRGFVHGAVIAALADNAMGLSYHASRVAEFGTEQKSHGALTLNLSVDYLATARTGSWLQVSPRVLKAGRSTGFVDAVVTADGERIARASAVFRVVG